MTRSCRKCGGTERNARGQCRPCNVRRSLAYIARRKAAGLTRLKNPGLEFVWRLRSAYGLEIQDYAALLFRQEGRCAVCGVAPRHDEPRLCVDHCHRSGKVRGLLCGHCNTAIGKFRDDASRMRRAAAYVEGHA